MRNDDLGKFVLRLMLGGLLIFHGIAKLIKGPAAINGMLAAAGYPAELGYLVYVGEFVAPLLLLIGLFTRPAALVIAINMVVALLLVHTKQLFALSPSTGGWTLELQAFFFFSALAIALLEPGSIRLGRRGGFWA